MDLFPIALSTNGKKCNEKLFEQYASAGIRLMELSIPREIVGMTDYRKALGWSEQYGVKLWSFHLPFSPFSMIDPSSEIDIVREYTITYFRMLMEKAYAECGVKLFVVHSSGERFPNRPAHLANAKNSLGRLTEIADKIGVTLAVEDLPRTCIGRNSEEILELLSADDRLRSCLDTNHLLSEDLPTYIRAVGSKIVTTHISDYDFLNERHWLPGEGQIDWQGVIGALKEVGYAGPWLYEISFTAPDSIVRPRDLTAADFVENARTLFAGSVPAPFGTPVAGLKSWTEI